MSMKSKTILVVEDNELNMELITDVLSLAGYSLLTAREAKTALKIAKESHPDLILMDIQLPGMDGMEATRHLKADPLTVSIPVVAVTSHAMKGDREKIEEAGCVGYFVKPINVRTIADDIKQFFG